MFLCPRKLTNAFNNIIHLQLCQSLEGKRCLAITHTANFYFSKAHFSEENRNNVQSRKSKPIKTKIMRPFKRIKTLLGGVEKSRKWSWRTVKIVLTRLTVFSITCLCVYIIQKLGKPPVDIHGHKVYDELADAPKVKQYILRSIRELTFYVKIFTEPHREQLVPNLTQLYRPRYTLVLELTDVLVHPDWTYEIGWRFKKRPGVQKFLELISSRYEIIIYTAEQGMTVFHITQAIDPNNVISYKLVRNESLFHDRRHVKKLKTLNRDLKRVIVVDWNEKSLESDRDNLLKLPRWEGQDNDDVLFYLTSMLFAIADCGVNDVRTICKNFKGIENPPLEFKDRQKSLIDRLENERRQELERNPSLWRWYRSFWRCPGPEG